MKMEKAMKTSGRRKNSTTPAMPEVKAVPANVESKPKTNGTSAMQTKPAPAPMATAVPPAKAPTPAPVQARPAPAPQPTKAAAPMSSDFKPMSQASKTAT